VHASHAKNLTENKLTTEFNMQENSNLMESCTSGSDGEKASIEHLNIIMSDSLRREERDKLIERNDKLMKLIENFMNGSSTSETNSTQIDRLLKEERDELRFRSDKLMHLIEINENELAVAKNDKLDFEKRHAALLDEFWRVNNNLQHILQTDEQRNKWKESQNAEWQIMIEKYPHIQQENYDLHEKIKSVEHESVLAKSELEKALCDKRAAEAEAEINGALAQQGNKKLLDLNSQIEALNRHLNELKCEIQERSARNEIERQKAQAQVDFLTESRLNLQRQLEVTNQERDRLTDQNYDTNIKVKSLESSLKEKNDLIGIMQQDLKHKTNHKDECFEEVKKMNKEVLSLNETIKVLKERLVKANTEKDRLISSSNAIANDFDKVQQANTEFDIVLKANRRKEYTKEREIGDLRLENSRLKQESTNIRLCHDKLLQSKEKIETENAEMRKQLTQMQHKVKQDEAQAKMQEEELQKLGEISKRADTRLEMTGIALDRCSQSEKRLAERVKELEESLLEECETSANAKATQQELEDQIRNLREESHALRQELEIIKGEKSTLQLAMEEKLTIRLPKQRVESHEVERNLASGKLRFYVEKIKHTNNGNSFLELKAKYKEDQDWLTDRGYDIQFNRAVRSDAVGEAIAKLLAQSYGMLTKQEENGLAADLKLKEKQELCNSLQQERDISRGQLERELEAKRLVLLRYIVTLKAAVSLGEPGSEEYFNEVGRPGAGKLVLPDSRLTNDDLKFLFATMRNLHSIEEWNLRGNYISDEGARLIASFLQRTLNDVPFVLKIIDLRGNGIGIEGRHAICSALGACHLVRRAYILPGGKIEAILGTSDRRDETETSVKAGMSVVVDLRDNEEHLFKDPMAPNSRHFVTDLCLRTEGGVARSFDTPHKKDKPEENMTKIEKVRTGKKSAASQISKQKWGDFTKKKSCKSVFSSRSSSTPPQRTSL